MRERGHICSSLAWLVFQRRRLLAELVSRVLLTPPEKKKYEPLPQDVLVVHAWSDALFACFRDNQTKRIQENISNVEKHFDEMCQMFAAYGRKAARLRDKADVLVREVADYADTETPGLKKGMKQFAEHLAQIQDYRQAEVWTHAGGFVDVDESTDASAIRGRMDGWMQVRRRGDAMCLHSRWSDWRPR